jgi:hypothetical protein
MSAEIDLPTLMTPETRRAIQESYLDFRLFAFGPNDCDTAGWYKEKYLGFTDGQYAIFEMYSNMMTPKRHRNMCKKLSHKSKELTTCSP